MNEERQRHKENIVMCLSDILRQEIELAIDGQQEHACPLVTANDYCMFINKERIYEVERINQDGNETNHYFECLKRCVRDKRGG